MDSSDGVSVLPGEGEEGEQQKAGGGGGVCIIILITTKDIKIYK